MVRTGSDEHVAILITCSCTLFRAGRLARGFAHVLVEIRQNLIDTEEKATAWGERLAGILRPVLDNPSLYESRHFGAHPVIGG